MELFGPLVAHIVKNLPRMQGTRVQTLGQEDPLGRGWLTTPVFFPGEFHGQRSLAGYSPSGHRGLDRIGADTHGTIQL